MGRLNALQVRNLHAYGFYADGGGLYLQVDRNGARSWIFRFMLNGRARDMGLGSAQQISLADARKQAEQYRRLRSLGIDPIEARDGERLQETIDAARLMTFEQCARSYIAAHRPSWKNDKYAAQWDSSLATHVYPVLGKLPVQNVDTTLILQVLEPIWPIITETASRIRGRMEAILDWATARGHRSGDNPARWRGHLQNLLPTPSKIHQVKHHSALPYSDIADFMGRLRSRGGTAARVLEFTILTAARRGEVLGAKWSEIDLERQVWTVPASRMKAGREHRVPLSSSAVRLLESLAGGKPHDLIFPSRAKARPLSDMAVAELLQRMDRTDITAHGFRSTFRDWIAECTTFPREVAESALAHTLTNKAEAAYWRGDMLEKRRRLMEAWARYCNDREEVVVALGVNATQGAPNEEAQAAA